MATIIHSGVYAIKAFGGPPNYYAYHVYTPPGAAQVINYLYAENDRADEFKRLVLDGHMGAEIDAAIALHYPKPEVTAEKEPKMPAEYRYPNWPKP